MKTAKLMTAEEFASLPDNGLRHELVRGEVREMSKPKPRHGRIAGKIYSALNAHVEKKKLGEVFPEIGYLIERDPDTARGPDCSFVRAERVPDPLPEEFFPFAPDLAVEVLSPGDQPGEIRDKIADWLRAGARAVWVLDPNRREATVHRPGADPRILKEGDLLEGEDILPGFSIALAEIFD